MPSLDDVQPLLSCELVRAQDSTDGVVEDFGCCTRQGAKTSVAQHAKKPLDRDIEGRGAMRDFERRKRMDVHCGDRVFYGAQQCKICVAIESRMNAALHADLGRTALPRLDGTAGHLFEREIVRLAAQC